MTTVIRVFITYFAIFIGLRILGKREFGQMSPIELVALLLIPELSSQAMLGEDFSIINAIIAIATLLSIIYLLSLGSHFSEKFSKVVTAEPTILVHDGKLIEKGINHERVEVEEIYTELHKVGLEKLEQVKWAILESDGTISIIPVDGLLQRPKNYTVT
jgi:uncharacterized membrane protein YcaP (DUF421 family)